MTQGVPAQQDPLAGLKDIHLPGDVSAWPLAWGWWVLMAVVLMICAAMIIAIYRHRKFNAPRRAALKQLATIKQDQPDWPAQMNQLLKRVACHYFGSAQASALYGEQWVKQLLSTLPAKQVSQCQPGLTTLQTLLYKPVQEHQGEFTPCQQAAQIWLTKAKFRSGVVTTFPSLEASHV